MPKLRAKDIAKRYGLNVCRPKYRAKGNWYVGLSEFPSALLDDNGYIFFPDSESYEEFLKDDYSIGIKKVTHGTQITIKNSISSHPSYRQFPDDLGPEGSDEEPEHWEGAKKQVWVNRFERDARARDACLKRWGNSCVVCGFNFEDVYGELGSHYIHVHHIVPLSEIGTEYRIFGERDLRPVCPNCHAMLHRKSDTMTVEALKELLESRKP